MTAVPIPTRCPACLADVTSQREAYTFARSYLCNLHREMWDAAHRRAHTTAGCPVAPLPCATCRGGAA